MKRNKWIELYHSALLEMAESDLRYPELSRCIASAQEAMQVRHQQLQVDDSHALEKRALEFALQNLQSAVQDLASRVTLSRA